MKVKLFFILFAGLIMPTLSVMPCFGLSKKEIKEYQREVSDMNKSLPMMTSKEMQLTRVYMRDSTVVYVVQSVLFNKPQIDINGLNNSARPNAVRSLCSSPDTSNMIKKGLTYSYVFYAKDGTYVHQYEVTARDCGF